MKTYIKFLILNLIICLSIRAFAEVASGDENTVKAPTLKSKSERDSRFIPVLNAGDYFAPIKAGQDRSYWPNQLTLIPKASMTLEDIKAKFLAAPWKVVFHCNGQAIHVEDFRKGPWVDGVVNRSINEIYLKDETGGMSVKQTLYPSEESSKGNYNTSQIKERNSPVVFTMIRNNQIKASFQKFRFHPVYQIVWVKETNEILFEAKKDSSNVPEEYKICPDKTEPKALLVPIAITS